MNLKRLIALSMIPSGCCLGTLALRVWLGAAMFALHGLEKLQNFGATAKQISAGGFPYPLAVGAILAESVAALFLVVGFATRWSALVLSVTMGVAFFHVHKGVLKGDGSGELAFIYFAGFIAILLAGPGRWSVDARLSK